MDFISELVLGYADLELSDRLKAGGITEFRILRYRDDYRTFVLDFENSAEDIEKGFQPFYDRVTLTKETDANQLYNIRTDLEKFAIHEAADLEAVANEWFGAKRSVEKLQAITTEGEIIDVFTAAGSSAPKARDMPAQGNALGLRHHFIEPCKGGTTVVPPLQGLFCSFLIEPRALPWAGMFAGLWPSAHVRLDKCMTGSNTSFTEDEIMVIKQLEKKISEDEALQQQLKNGAKHAVEATFRQVAEDAFEDLGNDNFKFYKKVSDDPEVSKAFAHTLRITLRSGNGVPAAPSFIWIYNFARAPHFPAAEFL